MSFFGSFMGTDQKHDLNSAYGEATKTLNTGAAQATGDLNIGYGAGQNLLKSGYKTVGAGYNQAQNALSQNQQQTQGYYQPYAGTDAQANTMYGNALGTNGLDAQKAFGQNYAASDPFRQQNSDMANEGLMRVLNARGMSGSGYAGEAVARQSFARGSEDYGNYLNRLQGLQGQGAQLAGQQAQMGQQYGQLQAGLQTGRANALAGIQEQRAGQSVDRGNALGNLDYGNAQQLAGMRTNLGNATAATRGIGVNNLFKVAGLAAQAFTGKPA